MKYELLTTKEVAKVLHVSVSYVDKLINTSALSSEINICNSERRVSAVAVANYKLHLDKQRHEGLADMVRISKESGLYEDD